MDLYTQIKKFYKDEITDDMFSNGTIILQDDNDGKGQYLKEWNIDLELPKDIGVKFDNTRTIQPTIQI